MDIHDINNQEWYLAQYITGGKNRENLFGWLSEQHMVPWTPLSIKKIKRSDKPNVYRKRISAVFPGYFFLKANFEFHRIDAIKMHTSFCDFVKFGSTLNPVKGSVVEGLMKIFPDPTLNPNAKDELDAASDIWLTKKQYRHLIRLEDISHPMSRISLLIDLIQQSSSYDF